MGNRCGAAGVSDNGVDGCWSRSGVDDDIDVASGVAGGVARGVKFSVKRLAGGRETRSTGSIAKGFSDDVVAVVLVTAGHALACEGVDGIVSLEVGATIAWCRRCTGHKARRTKAELAAVNKLRVRESETRACGQGIEKCTCSSACDTVKSGSVIRRCETNLEVMILGVGVHTAGGLWSVDNVR
jgi:hypothetical protein